MSGHLTPRRHALRRGSALVALVTFGVVSACTDTQTLTNETSNAGGITRSDDTSTPTTAQDSTATVDTNAATTSDPANSTAADGEITLGPGTFDFRDTTSGLAALSSYRATLTLSFTGAENGAASEWTTTYVMSASADPAARELTIESTGQVPDPDPVWMAEVQGAAYEQRGDLPCTSTTIEAGNSLAESSEPASLLTGLIGAEEAGDDTVNGVAVKRYTFDERALGQVGLATSTGEIAVATDGGYLVHYQLTTEGGVDFFGAGGEGTATWTYDVTNVNAPVAIAARAGCPTAFDVPLLPDATDVLSEPGLLTFVTASTPTDAAAFYQAQLPALGWQPTGEPVLVDNLAVQDYVRGDQQLQVIITLGDDGTTVLAAVIPASG